MNIKEAKEQIKNAMTAYFTKDETGAYALPAHYQRPVFLMGPPGIGKTAIMEQVANEMGVGLLSYSMTHHTRQSALGLPYIVKKNYAGMEYEVSEYTMSEIISSVYDLMENTGIREGILFLDEINCVSETLAPVMLQFLQYKVFGRHTVPEGWIVVTAGNPPEYNNSVRDFDIVTWDRLKRVDVEPDYDAWKEYAHSKNMHPAVLTYLEIRPKDFYRVETTVDGKSFVTARGWEDLSRMLRLYEKNGITADGKLVEQYLQHKKTAREFAAYYDLFNKYKSDYQVETILDGTAGAEILNRAKNAKFDERLALIGLILDAVNFETGSIMEQNEVTTRLMNEIKALRTVMARGNAAAVLSDRADKVREVMKAGRVSGAMSDREQRVLRLLADTLEAEAKQVAGQEGAAAFAVLKKDFDRRVKNLKTDAAAVKARLENMFAFAEKAFGGDQELLIIVTELTAGRDSAAFIARFGCDAYFRHNSDLLVYERRNEIVDALKELDIPELEF